MNVDSAFKFLNITETASLEEVNASYRRLLMEYHPIGIRKGVHGRIR